MLLLNNSFLLDKKSSYELTSFPRFPRHHLELISSLHIAESDAKLCRSMVQILILVAHSSFLSLTSFAAWLRGLTHQMYGDIKPIYSATRFEAQEFIAQTLSMMLTGHSVHSRLILFLEILCKT